MSNARQPALRAGLIVGLFAAVVSLGPAALVLSPKQDAPLAVLVLPWQSGAALRIAAAVGGSLIAASSGGTIAIVRSDDPAIVGNLYSAGALLVLDAAPVQACLRIVAKS